ncbi:hypothetical protein [Chitinophaga filiformis]|uniref:DUF4377 domain-containing protein n=1 Tax=Chitinophaga filiformis TaxID=104663 RepID=A0A1G7HTH5_CHIFI|nr:hypothetical protein [Chitinophaga filiformis]SDF03636.1 hypothetical protein SAMN04488121_101593 [Chitinophaga filiformis]
MKKILILVVICACAFACSKDDGNSPDSKKSYSPSDVVTVDETVMYTGGAPIYDKALIKDYLTRRGQASSYILDAATGSGAHLSSYTLEFQDEKNVLLGNIKTEIISKNDTLMMLAAVDYTQDSPYPNTNVADSIINLAQLGGPASECPTYYTAPCKYRRKFPVRIVNGQYYFAYVVATATSTWWEPSPFGVPMELTDFKHLAGPAMLFDRNVTSKLSQQNNKDTLVVQILRRPLTMQ